MPGHHKNQMSNDLQQLAWMLEKKDLGRSGFVPDYGDLSLLNRDGPILTMVGREQLQDIVSDYLDLMETSGAVYERNGDYALGIFTSGWCQLMDSSSRKLCNTESNLEALKSGKWLCHESCWKDASLKCMEQEKPVDVPCAGGLRLYAVPVKAEGKVVGAINFGYGDPPSDEETLKALANKYDIPLQELRKQAKAYKSRPPFIIDLAKHHITKSAKYIGNIIERKLAEKAAQENEQQLRITLDSIGDAVIATDIQAMITRMNPEAEKLCGCSLERSKGKSLTDVFHIVHALTGEKAENPVKKVLQTGRVVGLANHTMLISKDGNEYQIADSASPIRDEKGNITGVVLVFRDVTEEYTMQERLRLSEERLNFAMMVKNDGLWDWDIVTNSTFFDDRYYTMAGYAPDEFPQTFKGWAEHVHPDDLEASQNAIKAYLSGASDNFDIEFRFRRKIGKWMWIQGKGKIVERDAQGNPLRMIGTHTDITERKQAEEKLRESEERFRVAQELSPDGFTILHPLRNSKGEVVDFTWIYQNQAIGHINGTYPEDVAGKRLLDLFPTHRGTNVFDTYLHVASTGETLILEEVYVGNVLSRPTWLRIVVVSMGEDIAIHSQDITERKQAEEALSKTQFAVDNSPLSIFWISPEGKFIYVNKTAVEKLGYSCEELLSMHIWDVDSNYPQERRKVQWELYQKEGAFSFESEHRRRDGTTFPVCINSCHLAFEGQEIEIAEVQDITEQKETEKTKQVLFQIANETLHNFKLNDFIKAVEQQLSKLVDTTNFYIALYDAETGILSAPFEKDEKDRIDTWPAKGSATGLVIEKKQPVLLTKQDVFRLIESGEIEQTGSICESWLGVPLFKGSEVSGVIVVQSYDNPEAFDSNTMELFKYVSNQISIALERTKVFEDLLHAKNKAEESDRLKSAFLANMSHEIRTPMNGILGFAELLKEPHLSDEQQEKYIGIIEKSGERMLNIINDIVDISRIESGLMDVSLVESNINEQLEYIYSFFKPQVEAKGMQLVLSSVLPAEQAKVITDREKLFAVLTNLVKNAIKYSKEGFIEYGCRKKGSFLEFFVKDTGIGIPKDRQHAIFSRFVQADIEDIEARQGAGLGLAIAKAYVEMLGGSIWVESEEGKGSSFCFTIPNES